MSDQADKAHQEKEAKTGAGERMVPHATFTDGDRELRAEADRAEVARVEAFEETGYIAAPGVGDYHAARRAAKGATGAGVDVEDPSTLVLDQVRDGAKSAREDAANLRRGAGESRAANPPGRRSAPRVATTGNTPANQTADDKSGDATKPPKGN